jgi:hypothetical protein
VPAVASAPSALPSTAAHAGAPEQTLGGGAGAPPLRFAVLDNTGLLSRRGFISVESGEVKFEPATRGGWALPLQSLDHLQMVGVDRNLVVHAGSERRKLVSKYNDAIAVSLLQVLLSQPASEAPGRLLICGSATRSTDGLMSTAGELRLTTDGLRFRPSGLERLLLNRAEWSVAHRDISHTTLLHAGRLLVISTPAGEVRLEGALVWPVFGALVAMGVGAQRPLRSSGLRLIDIGVTRGPVQQTGKMLMTDHGFHFAVHGLTGLVHEGEAREVPWSTVRRVAVEGAERDHLTLETRSERHSFLMDDALGEFDQIAERLLPMTLVDDPPSEPGGVCTDPLTLGRLARRQQRPDFVASVWKHVGRSCFERAQLVMHGDELRVLRLDGTGHVEADEPAIEVDEVRERISHETDPTDVCHLIRPPMRIRSIYAENLRRIIGARLPVTLPGLVTAEREARVEDIVYLGRSDRRASFRAVGSLELWSTISPRLPWPNGDGSEKVHLSNLSLGGCSLLLPASVEVGTPLVFDIRFRNHQVRVAAVVRYTKALPDLPELRRAGCAFNSLTVREAESLNRLWLSMQLASMPSALSPPTEEAGA